MGIRITGSPFFPRGKAASQDASLSQDHPSVQARAHLASQPSPLLLAAQPCRSRAPPRPAPGTSVGERPSFYKPEDRQFAPTVSPGLLSSAPAAQQDTVAPQRLVPSTDLFASRDHPLHRQRFLLASPSSRICRAPAALLSLAKSPSPFSLPFTDCLNLHHKAAGSKHALECTNPWDVSWWVAEAEPQAL